MIKGTICITRRGGGKSWHNVAFTGDMLISTDRWKVRKKWYREYKVYHQLKEHEFGQTLEDSGGWGELACCGLWFAKNWTLLSEWAARKYK